MHRRCSDEAFRDTCPALARHGASANACHARKHARLTSQGNGDSIGEDGYDKRSRTEGEKKSVRGKAVPSLTRTGGARQVVGQGRTEHIVDYVAKRIESRMRDRLAAPNTPSVPNLLFRSR